MVATIGVSDKAHALEHCGFGFAHRLAAQKHADDGGCKTNQEDREAGYEPDEENEERQESAQGGRGVFTVFDLSHDSRLFFLGDDHAAATHVGVATDGGNQEDRQAGDQAENIEQTEADACRCDQGDLRRVRETGQVADVTGVSLNTSALVGVNTKANSSRTRNDSRDNGLRETSQSADHTCSDTAGGANAGAAAELVADAHDVANDNVKEAGGLHDADEEQDARHVGDHRVQTGVNHLGNGHFGASHNGETGNQSRERCADDCGHVDRRFARNHQEQRQYHNHLRNYGSCHFSFLWFVAHAF